MHVPRVLSTVLALLLPVVGVGFAEVEPPPELVWDLSRSQTIADLRWPADKPSEYCALQGE